MIGPYTQSAILALDAANQCGWCWGAPDCEIEFGDVSLKVRDDEHPGQRLLRMTAFLDKLLERRSFEVIAVEDAQQGSHNRLGIVSHAKLLGCIEQWAAVHGLPIQLWNPMTIKAQTANNGGASKAEVEAAVRRFFGACPANFDQSDAIAIYYLVRQGKLPTGEIKRRRRIVQRREKSRKAGWLFK